jgi:hypothetical protein
MPADCQVSEESLDLAFSHVFRMTLIMEEDKAPNPADRYNFIHHNEIVNASHFLVLHNFS